MKAATIVVGACLCLVAIVSNVHRSNATSIAPVQALLQRLLPDHADQFQLTIVDDVTTAASDNNANTGTFTVGAPSSVPGQPGSGGPVVAIQGSDPVAVSSGILWYLKYRVRGLRSVALLLAQQTHQRMCVHGTPPGQRQHLVVG